jgi:hypothetical protein
MHCPNKCGKMSKYFSTPVNRTMQEERTKRPIPPQIDTSWNIMFKVGGISFAITGVLFIFVLVGLELLGPYLSSNPGVELAYINSHAFYYSIAYYSQLAAGILLIPSVCAMFLALRQVNLTMTTVAFGTMLVGIPIFLASAAGALSVLTIANSYVSSVEAVQSDASLGAGLAIMTNSALLSAVTQLLFAIGSIINGLVFVRSKYFGRLLGALVIVGGVLTFPGVIYVPALALAIILFAAAFMIAGWKLYAISRKSVPL